jgi:hypothetical protein
VLYRYRAALIIAIVAVAAGAAASIRWQTWTPVTACLLCETPGGGDAGATPEAALPAATGGTLAANGDAAPGSIGAGALVVAPPAQSGGQTGSSTSRFGPAPRGWQPWSATTGTYRVASPSRSGPSPSLGGLWRLMSLSKLGHGGGSSAPVSETVIAANHPVTPPEIVKAPTVSPAPGTCGAQ